MRSLALLALLVVCGPAWAGDFWTNSPPGVPSSKTLYVTGASVGNGADTTEDTLQSFTVAAGQLVNVGDRLHIVAGGVMAATTDTKTVRVRFGGTIIAVLQGTNATSIGWSADLWLVKTGTNTQAWIDNGGVVSVSGMPTTRSGTTSINDSSAIAILVTGQDGTTATANAVTCQVFSVDYVHN